MFRNISNVFVVSYLFVNIFRRIVLSPRVCVYVYVTAAYLITAYNHTVAYWSRDKYTQALAFETRVPFKRSGRILLSIVRRIPFRAHTRTRIGTRVINDVNSDEHPTRRIVSVLSEDDSRLFHAAGIDFRHFVKQERNSLNLATQV